MKILIAEDEPSLRENLQWMLELEGYEVMTAKDGRDAYVQACRTRPDLVLTDVMMPVLDGYGLLSALRENSSTATVPIIMLTAKADRSDVRMGMNLGADDYLTKPYKRDELLEAIQARLARSSSQEQAAQTLQKQMQQAQQFDPLTSLPNRELFDQQLAAALEHAGRSQGGVVVVCVGLDGFAKVNESLGSATGDLVLQEVANRLLDRMGASTQTGAHDSLARLGGDQFAICLSGTPDTAMLERICSDLLELLARPYLIDDRSLFLTACAGASQFPAQADSAQTLLLNAESALHHAKSGGPSSFRLFDPAMNQQVVRRLQIHNALYQALEQGALQVFYQPQVSIASGAVVGFEALLRWNHPTLGWISPAEFIPIAEDSGFIVKLGEWVMRTAARQAADWHALGHNSFRMAVNLSVRQFADPRLPSIVQQVLTDTGLPPHMLELEVTESLALQSVTSTIGTFNACKALGVKLAMDDFGTGYSSLAYLKRYPLDSLKIDQAFIRNLTQDAGDAAITRAIVAMAHSFGMSVIAEGVETTGQLDFLRTLGCEDFQGYLFSRPVPADEAVLCFTGYHPG
jgi:diguanylate cyclase (GGDEF)-like protein